MKVWVTKSIYFRSHSIKVATFKNEMKSLLEGEIWASTGAGKRGHWPPWNLKLVVLGVFYFPLGEFKAAFGTF